MVRGGTEDWGPGQSSDGVWKKSKGPRQRPNTQPSRQEAELPVVLGVCVRASEERETLLK